MNLHPFGNTGLNVSHLSFGASSLGGVFRSVDEGEAIQSVHVALELGINYIDVAPAYGGTRSETVLGKALKGVPRDSYYVSTKIGKYTDPDTYGADTFDYSESSIRRSVDESSERMGVEYFDILHIHDIEYNNGAHTEWALDEGVRTLRALKREGRIGVINASPFAGGLLTNRGPADWHPADTETRALFARAAAHCAARGSDISKLALQFSCQNPDIPTTMFSSANPDSVRRNVAWSEEPYDPQLLEEVQEMLAPVSNQEWGD